MRATQSPPTDRLVTLRAVLDADLESFFQDQCDREAAQMVGFSPRDRPACMAHWRRILADPATMIRTILADGHVAGNIVSFEQDREREVGYWLGKPYWGQGIATRALMLFLEQISVRPLSAHVALHNHASRRVLEKCGFVIRAADAEAYTLQLGDAAHPAT